MAGKSIAVLDIRSSEVAVFVGERGVNNTFVFKASKTESYGGYQDGEFYDVSDLSQAVLRALDAVQQVCGERIRSLYVGVPGEFTKVEPLEQDLGFPKKLKISTKELDQLFAMGRKPLDGWRYMRVTSMVYVTADNRRVADPVGLYSTGLSGVLSYFYVSEYFAGALEHVFSRRRIELHFLPTQFAMAAYLIPPETRDEYALFLDIGYLSSSFLVLLGNGVLAQRTFWAGEGQIAVRLMKRFSLPYEVATALLSKANLYLKREAKNREVVYGGRSYEIPTKEFIEEVKAGLDELCELVGRHTEVIEYSERHDGTALRVVTAVDKISDVVQESGDSGKFNLSFRVGKLFKNVRGSFRHFCHVRKTVLGVPKSTKRFVSFYNVSSDGSVVFHIVEGNQDISP